MNAQFYGYLQMALEIVINKLVIDILIMLQLIIVNSLNNGTATRADTNTAISVVHGDLA